MQTRLDNNVDKQSREKLSLILADKRKKMIEANSSGLALSKGDKDTVLFGIEREEDGYRVAVYYVLDNVIVDKKVGASQLKHHSIAIMEQFISNYVIDFYERPKEFFETVVIN